MWRRTGPCLLMGALLSGCVTPQQHYALEREVQALKAAGVVSGRGGRPEERLADLGTQVDALHDEIARLRGQLEETRYVADEALAEIRASRGRDAPAGSRADPAGGDLRVSAPHPSGPAGAVSKEIRSYEAAYALYRAGDYPAAVDRFTTFLENHPSSDYADNALFWKGDCYFKLDEFDRAVLAFEEVEKRYPNGNKVPDALYRQGVALIRIGEEKRQEEAYRSVAKQVFQRIVQEYPDSPRVAEARRQLETLGP